MTQQEDTNVVNDQWLSRHGIKIPRLPGLHESGSAWAKVNGHGVITSAGEKDQTILGWLIARNVLSRIDEEYGIAFLTTRSAFRGTLDVVPSSLYDKVIAQGGIVSGPDNAVIYQQVCRDIGRNYRRAVEYACDTPFVPGQNGKDASKDEGNSRLKHYHYREAFSALIRSFDEQIRALSQRRQPS